jgi:hypothetical protein
MANEFHYCVSLSIVHPTADPELITAAITSLRPRIQAMAGSERLGKDGKPIVPNRKVMLSHWLANLHDEPKMCSSDKPVSDFILEQLVKLEKHHSLFAHLQQLGQVTLRIGWFSDTNYSADVLTAKTLKKCGDLGIDIELNYYGPSCEEEEVCLNGA